MYSVGEIVRIVTPEEYFASGHSCTEDCAIAAYANLKVQIVKALAYGQYRVCPVEERELNDKKFRFVRAVSDYTWDDKTLVPVQTVSAVETDEYFDILMGS